MILPGIVVGAVVGYYVGTENGLFGLVGALLGAGAGLVIELFGYAESALLRALFPALRKTPADLVVEEFKRLQTEFDALAQRADSLELRFDLDEVVIDDPAATRKAIQALLKSVARPAQA